MAHFQRQVGMFPPFSGWPLATTVMFLKACVAYSLQAYISRKSGAFKETGKSLCNLGWWKIKCILRIITTDPVGRATKRKQQKLAVHCSPFNFLNPTGEVIRNIRHWSIKIFYNCLTRPYQLLHLPIDQLYRVTNAIDWSHQKLRYHVLPQTVITNKENGDKIANSISRQSRKKYSLYRLYFSFL